MKDFSTDLGELRKRVGEAAKYLNVETSRGLLIELEVEVAKPDLWNDQDHAKEINSQYVAVKSDLDEFNHLSNTLDDLFVLHDLADRVSWRGRDTSCIFCPTHMGMASYAEFLTSQVLQRRLCSSSF